ncbi:MAG: iron ABC transporter permease [Bacteroidales bacterium]|nr:MAG: iron ABC transporter permease [Bacteroidales bacterium]
MYPEEQLHRPGEWKRVILIFTGLVILMVLFFALDLFIGSVRISLVEICRTLFSGSADPEYNTIILKFRLPRALTAILAGFSLSLSGLQMQTVFRNPLAGPFVLGISSGASLGVAILVLGVSSSLAVTGMYGLGNWAIAIAAWAGSGIILFLVLIVSLRVRDIMTILILGILFGSATAAVVSILQYFSSETHLKAFVVWTMGSLGSVSISQLSVLGISTLVGIAISLVSVKILNIMLLGENYSRSLGLNIRLSRFVIFLSTSILAGSVTAFCGPIAFIGIAVPHIARMIFRTADHRILLPGTLFTGAILLLISDMVSQLPGYETTLPINSVTALLGIPIVIAIIVRSRKVSVFV